MKLLSKSHIALLLSMASLFTNADDTEIYTGLKPTVPPNVIFIMDTSGSMANSAGNGKSRLQVVREAATNTINKTDNINISLMRFNSNSQGGYVSLAMTPIADARDKFKNKINSFPASGGTPIAESLHEAILYLKGDSSKYGNYYADSNAYRNGKYKSPITHQCQQNHIVLFSDGEPSGDMNSDANIMSKFNQLPEDQKALITSNSDVEQCGATKIGYSSYWSYSSQHYNTYQNRNYSHSTYSNNRYYHYYSSEIPKDGTCAEELALYANSTDLTDKFDGIQNVTIHTVGGFIEGEAALKLENTARFGSWSAPNAEFNSENESSAVKTYFLASNAAGLETALTSIFDNITTVSTTFTAPAVSVNAFNNLEHLDQLYYSVFKPNKSVSWSGNLKRYRLTSKGAVYDVNNAPAVDSTTGFFADSAQSFWTLNKRNSEGALIPNPSGKNPDGKEVTQGGAASRLAENRSVYTYLGGNTSLKNAANRLHESNSNLVPSLFGLSSSSERSKVIKWGRGVDVKDQDQDNDTSDIRAFIEDPLHSQPLVITYGKNTNNNTFDSSIFMATNSGFLHAFSTDASNPEEHFSFIPEELLVNLTKYYNGAKSLNKVYGLDGPMSYWHKDNNFNGVILDKSNALEENEHIYLYTGMRRGGRSYYALDISDRTDPKFLWQINNTTTGFSKLGQTWSKMTLATVKFKGKKEKVLFFGGGYDPDEDNKTTRSNSAMGNAIYMVRASDGTLLWDSSNSGAKLNLTDMKNSIVADIIPVDSTLDGYANILYTADVGGRVWRIDLDNSSLTASNFAQGGVIADFNGGNTSRNIRFFNTPDVSFTRYGGFSPDGQFQISIGSGYRAHPLDTKVKDRFYIINDVHVSTVPTSYSDYSESDLANAASFSSASVDQQEAGTYTILTGEGEKVLASSVTVADNILFTTYRPTDSSQPVSCDSNTGYTRLYQVKPIAPKATTGETLDRDWGFEDLAQGGIPPNPVVLFPPSGDGDDDSDGGGECNDEADCDTPSPESCEQLKSITAVGAETLHTSITRCDQLSKSYWLENE